MSMLIYNKVPIFYITHCYQNNNSSNLIVLIFNVTLAQCNISTSCFWQHLSTNLAKMTNYVLSVKRMYNCESKQIIVTVICCVESNEILTSISYVLIVLMWHQDIANEDIIIFCNNIYALLCPLKRMVSCIQLS